MWVGRGACDGDRRRSASLAFRGPYLPANRHRSDLLCRAGRRMPATGCRRSPKRSGSTRHARSSDRPDHHRPFASKVRADLDTGGFSFVASPALSTLLLLWRLPRRSWRHLPSCSRGGVEAKRLEGVCAAGSSVEVVARCQRACSFCRGAAPQGPELPVRQSVAAASG
jgi:hypothetical protein